MIQAHCSSCHTFDYQTLLGGTERCRTTTFSLVDTSTPDASYLLIKVDPALAADRCGVLMPQNGQLPASDIDLMRRWIAAGAPRN